MKNPRMSLVAIVALLCGCGGAVTPAQDPAGPTPVTTDGPSLVRAIFTTAVDAKKQSAAPPSTDFGRDTEQIFVIAQVSGLSPGAQVRMIWGATKSGAPQEIPVQAGAGVDQFVASIHAPAGGFEGGDYQVFVDTADTRIGRASFHIGGKATDWTGVRGLVVSSAITAWTNEAIEPKSSFDTGVKRIYAGFQVRTNDPNPYVTVIWLQGEKELAVGNLECAREVRCIDAFEKGKQIPTGDYAVEIQINGEFMAQRSFHVGGDPVSPMLVHTALGLAKGKAKQMPQKHKDFFKSATTGLRCGMGFVGLPDKAKVQVTWIALTEAGDQERYKSQETVTGGGSKTAVIDWPIDGNLAPGRYKAVIHLGSRLMTEIPFTIE